MKLMNPTGIANKRWADQFLPDQQRLIRAHIGALVDIRLATLTEDMKWGFDCFVEVTASGGWALRVRKPLCTCRAIPDDHLSHYRDITLRTTPRWPDEYDKVMEGLGDYCLYGWTTPDSEQRGRLAQWVIIDLHKFRADAEWVNATKALGRNKEKGDNDFYWWSWQSLNEQGMVVATNMRR